MSGMHRDRVKDPVKRQSRLRTAVQATAAVFFNGYAAGFFKAKIFTGKTKGLCVPVLNCYSCPGALGACPIGSLQAVLAGKDRRVPFYVLGTLMLFGVLLGRLACGFLCPFGFLQDLLSKLPVKKIKIPKKADRLLRLLKYAVLLGAVWIPRFFCRYLCPLGAIYGLFNRFSLSRMALDKEKCVGCGVCEKAGPMAVDVTKDINTAECIRCGKCKAACPTGAIRRDPLVKGKKENSVQKDTR